MIFLHSTFYCIPKQGKEIIKGIKIRKEEIKQSPFANNMIIYVQKPKVSSTIRTNKIIQQGHGIQDYYIKISSIFYASSKPLENKFLKLPFRIASKHKKILVSAFNKIYAKHVY